MSDSFSRQLRVAFIPPEHRGKSQPKEAPFKGLLRRYFREPSTDNSVTYAQYVKLNDNAKGQRKNAAGALVAGQFEGNTRKKADLKFRSMVFLDVDNATPEQFEDITLGIAPICRYVGFYATTRSHSPEKPKFRIGLPLTRDATPDEIQPLTRYLALDVNDDQEAALEMVDKVSYRPNQIMYLPTVSKGQEYVFGTMGDTELDPDSIFRAHPDWTDASNWPSHPSEDAERLDLQNIKADDPREKMGVIGAFCRAYGVHEAIAQFIPDIYIQTDNGDDDRYTFALGSGTEGGAIVYQNLKLHSHHGTDPCDGQVNAFDMVRLHLFGQEDKPGKEYDSPTQMPSFKAMKQFALRDPEVKIEMFAERDRLRDEFDDAEDEDEDDDEDGEDEIDLDDLGLGDEIDLDDFGLDDEPGEASKKTDEKKPKKKKKNAWRKDLRMDAEGSKVLASANNVSLILRHEPSIEGRIRFDEFRKKMVVFKRLTAFDVVQDPILNAKEGRGWNDTDVGAYTVALSSPEALGGYEIEVGKDKMQMCAEQAAKEHRFHPVKDSIEAITWDGVERAETMFVDYLGVEEHPYYHETCRHFLLAAITRIYEPGHKFDNVPILGGTQGVGKSTFISILSFGFFGELAPQFDNAGRMIESMQGKWIMEVPELAGFRKAEVEAIKQFFSATVDTHRLAYRTNAEDFPREQVFIGSTNKEEYLKDETGNRRFWPIKVEAKSIDTSKLRRDVGQIWAEVLTWYRQAREEKPRGPLALGVLSSRAANKARLLQEDSRVENNADLMRERILEWLETPRARDWAAESDQFDDDADVGDDKFLLIRASRDDLWNHALGRDRQPNAFENTDLGHAMKTIPGWKCDRRMLAGKRTTWVWKIGSDFENAGWEPLE